MDQKSNYKYWCIRSLATFLGFSSWGFGFLAGAEYGKWVGWGTFIMLLGMAFFLVKITKR